MSQTNLTLKSGRKCFLDMDGVLSDFIGGACAVHGRNDFVEYDIWKYWGMSEERFWEPLCNREFWAGLERTLEADDIIAAAVRNYDTSEIYILTMPSRFSPEESAAGKLLWIKKHYPFLADQYILTRDKALLAGPRTLLVDDNDDNIRIFEEAGGRTFLVPRPWNVAGRLGWRLNLKNLEDILAYSRTFER